MSSLSQTSSSAGWRSLCKSGRYLFFRILSQMLLRMTQAFSLMVVPCIGGLLSRAVPCFIAAATPWPSAAGFTSKSFGESPLLWKQFRACRFLGLALCVYLFLSRAKLEHDQPPDQPLHMCGSSSCCGDEDRGPRRHLGLSWVWFVLSSSCSHCSCPSSKPPVVHREGWYSGCFRPSAETCVGTFHGAGKHEGHDRAGLFHSGSPESRSLLWPPSIPTVGSFPDIAMISIP